MSTARKAFVVDESQDYGRMSTIAAAWGSAQRLRLTSPSSCSAFRQAPPGKFREDLRAPKLRKACSFTIATRQIQHRTCSKHLGGLITAVASSFTPVKEETIALPLDYYQILGVDTHFLADAIARAYDQLVNNPPAEGFSQSALVARQEILRGACETLADPNLRGEYNESLAEDEAGTITVDVPLSKVPGALCLLQEAGEMEVVLQVGQSLLQEPLSKSFRCDVVLAMALAYVELSREAVAESPPAIVQSCDMLERALKLLQGDGASSLAPALQEQIDETLQQLYPRCILDLLALPLDKEHQGKREEGLQGIRSILWAVGEEGAFSPIPGFTREEFMKKAFSYMTAAEQMALFIATPSHIPAESFEVHMVALAHVAEGFIGKKPHLIQEADALFLQLQQTNASPDLTGNFHSADQHLEFAFERGMCALLLGELDDCRAWLGLDDVNSPYRNPSTTEFVNEHSAGSEEGDYLPGLCKLLESWLTDVVFPSSRQVENMQVKISDYYDHPGVLSYLEKLKKGDSPLAAAAAIVQLGVGAGAALDIVKTSALETLQKVFPIPKERNSSNVKEINNELLDVREGQLYNRQKREDHSQHVAADNPSPGLDDTKGNYLVSETVKDKVSPVKFVYWGALIGALAVGGWMAFFTPNIIMKLQKEGPASIKTMDSQDSFTNRRRESVLNMDAHLAEDLVRNWQAVKAQALGPSHALEKFSEVLDGQMLKGWSERASDVSKNGWYWEYKLKRLSIDSVTISTDGGKALVEATLQEAATLYDEKKDEATDAYDTRYTTRYEFTLIGGKWKISAGTVLRPK